MKKFMYNCMLVTFTTCGGANCLLERDMQPLRMLYGGGIEDVAISFERDSSESEILMQSESDYTYELTSSSSSQYMSVNCMPSDVYKSWTIISEMLLQNAPCTSLLEKLKTLPQDQKAQLGIQKDRENDYIARLMHPAIARSDISHVQRLLDEMKGLSMAYARFYKQEHRDIIRILFDQSLHDLQRHFFNRELSANEIRELGCLEKDLQHSDLIRGYGPNGDLALNDWINVVQKIANGMRELLENDIYDVAHIIGRMNLLERRSLIFVIDRQSIERHFDCEWFNLDLSTNENIAKMLMPNIYDSLRHFPTLQHCLMKSQIGGMLHTALFVQLAALQARRVLHISFDESDFVSCSACLLLDCDSPMKGVELSKFIREMHDKDVIQVNDSPYFSFSVNKQNMTQQCRLYDDKLCAYADLMDILNTISDLDKNLIVLKSDLQNYVPTNLTGLRIYHRIAQMTGYAVTAQPAEFDMLAWLGDLAKNHMRFFKKRWRSRIKQDKTLRGIILEHLQNLYGVGVAHLNINRLVSSALESYCKELGSVKKLSHKMYQVEQDMLAQRAIGDLIFASLTDEEQSEIIQTTSAKQCLLMLCERIEQIQDFGCAVRSNIQQMVTTDYTKDVFSHMTAEELEEAWIGELGDGLIFAQGANSIFNGCDSSGFFPDIISRDYFAQRFSALLDTAPIGEIPMFRAPIFYEEPYMPFCSIHEGTVLKHIKQERERDHLLYSIYNINFYRFACFDKQDSADSMWHSYIKWLKLRAEKMRNYRPIISRCEWRDYSVLSDNKYYALDALNSLCSSATRDVSSTKKFHSYIAINLKTGLLRLLYAIIRCDEVDSPMQIYEGIVSDKLDVMTRLVKDKLKMTSTRGTAEHYSCLSTLAFYNGDIKRNSSWRDLVECIHSDLLSSMSNIDHDRGRLGKQGIFLEPNIVAFAADELNRLADSIGRFETKQDVAYCEMISEACEKVGCLLNRFAHCNDGRYQGIFYIFSSFIHGYLNNSRCDIDIKFHDIAAILSNLLARQLITDGVTFYQSGVFSDLQKALESEDGVNLSLEQQKFYHSLGDMSEQMRDIAILVADNANKLATNSEEATFFGGYIALLGDHYGIKQHSSENAWFSLKKLACSVIDHIYRLYPMDLETLISIAKHFLSDTDEDGALDDILDNLGRVAFVSDMTDYNKALVNGLFNILRRINRDCSDKTTTACDIAGCMMDIPLIVAKLSNDETLTPLLSLLQRLYIEWQCEQPNRGTPQNVRFDLLDSESKKAVVFDMLAASGLLAKTGTAIRGSL